MACKAGKFVISKYEILAVTNYDKKTALPATKVEVKKPDLRRICLHFVSD